MRFICIRRMPILFHVMIVDAKRRAAASGPRSIRANRTPTEYFAAAGALILPIAFAAGLASGVWSLRSAVLLVVAAVGLPILISQARGPHSLAARAAVAFLAFGSASSALSQNHTTAVFGLYGQGTGLLFMASLAGAWAIGRSLHPDARPMLERALLLGVFVNIGIALLESMVDVGRISPDLVGEAGRVSGLAGNPVHLAALAVLAVALLLPRFAAAPMKWALPVAAAAAATQLSGTRGAVVIMVVIVVWAAHRIGLRITALFTLALILGLAAGTAIGTSSNATGRAGQVGSLSNRPATWLSASHSIIEHPVLGVGPGQFRTATSPYRPVSVARSEGPERLFTDAHNIFIEYLTTTGLLGLGALLVWLFAAIRSSHGWLLVGALGVLVIHLFEPQSVITTPLAFLALGASAALGVDRRERRSPILLAAVSCCMVGAFAAASMFLLGEFEMNQVQLDLRVAPAQEADRLLPAWPLTASLVARAWLFRGITNHHNQAEYKVSRSWRLAAVQRDNTDPELWNLLAELDESLGNQHDALIEYTSALRLNPTSTRAMDGLARLAHDSCDVNLERFWRQRALQIVPAPVAPTPLRRASAQAAKPKCAGVARL